MADNDVEMKDSELNPTTKPTTDQPSQPQTKKRKQKKIKLRFRNYFPKSEKLRKYYVEPAKVIDKEDEFTTLIEHAKKGEPVSCF